MLGLTKVIIGMCAAVVAAAAALIGCAVSHHDASLPRASCGRISTHMLASDTQLLSETAGALSCFDAAARSCHAASIEVTEMGVDSGTQYVFAVMPGAAACQVTEFSQDYSANNGGSESQVTTTSCSQLTVTDSGVTFRCGGAQILIPAAVGHGAAAS